MDFVIHRPDGLLASFVKFMWSMELRLTPGQAATERISPTGCSCVPYVLMSALQVEIGVDIRPLRNFR